MSIKTLAVFWNEHFRLWLFHGRHSHSFCKNEKRLFGLFLSYDSFNHSSSSLFVYKNILIGNLFVAFSFLHRNLIFYANFKFSFALKDFGADECFGVQIFLHFISRFKFLRKFVTPKSWFKSKLMKTSRFIIHRFLFGEVHSIRKFIQKYTSWSSFNHIKASTHVQQTIS